MVAITKADLVDDETLELAELEITEHLDGHAARGDADRGVRLAVGSRARRGAGHARRRARGGARPRATPDRPRLWVDRVFAAKGAGTVVTGTLTGGTVRLDDELEVGGRGGEGAGPRHRDREAPRRRRRAGEPGRPEPRRRRAPRPRARRRRSCARDSGRAPPPSTCACSGYRARRSRGAGACRCTSARASTAPGCRMLDPDGEFARLRFTEPLHARAGRPRGDPRSRPRAHGRRCRGARRRGTRSRDRRGRRISDCRSARGWSRAPTGSRSPTCHASRGCRASEVDAFVADVVASGAAERAGDWLVDPETRAQLRDEARSTGGAAPPRRTDRSRASSSRRSRRRCASTPARLRAALDGHTRPRRRARRRARRSARHACRRVTRGPSTGRRARRVAVLATRHPSDVGAPVALVRTLVRDGVLVDVDGVIFTATALDAARQRVIDVLAERGTITVADVRDALGSSRKYVVPIVGLARPHRRHPPPRRRPHPRPHLRPDSS